MIVAFTVTNTDVRAEAELYEVRFALPSSLDDPRKRLIRWSHVPQRPDKTSTSDNWHSGSSLRYLESRITYMSNQHVGDVVIEVASSLALNAAS